MWIWTLTLFKFPGLSSCSGVKNSGFFYSVFMETTWSSCKNVHNLCLSYCEMRIVLFLKFWKRENTASCPALLLSCAELLFMRLAWCALLTWHSVSCKLLSPKIIKTFIGWRKDLPQNEENLRCFFCCFVLFCFVFG